MNTFKRRSAIALIVAGVFTTACTDAYADGHAGTEVAINNFAFEPARLVVKAGTKVTFINNDGAPHTATAKNGSFDTGNLRRGQKTALTFTKPGTYQYYCAIHPMMKATIIVE